MHRVVAEQLIEETPFSIRILLPWPYEVHHMDYNKTNNEPHNLLLLSEQFHSVLTVDRPRNLDGTFGNKFKARWKPPPPWALFKDDSEEIPF